MKERILLLADRAYDEYKSDTSKYSINIPDDYALYFAKLIARECVDTIMETSDRYRKEYFADKISEKFGLK